MNFIKLIGLVGNNVRIYSGLTTIIILVILGYKLGLLLEPVINIVETTPLDLSEQKEIYMKMTGENMDRSYKWHIHELGMDREGYTWDEPRNEVIKKLSPNDQAARIWYTLFKTVLDHVKNHSKITSLLFKSWDLSNSNTNTNTKTGAEGMSEAEDQYKKEQNIYVDLNNIPKREDIINKEKLDTGSFDSIWHYLRSKKKSEWLDAHMSNMIKGRKEVEKLGSDAGIPKGKAEGTVLEDLGSTTLKLDLDSVNSTYKRLRKKEFSFYNFSNLDMEESLIKEKIITTNKEIDYGNMESFILNDKNKALFLNQDITIIDKIKYNLSFKSSNKTDNIKRINNTEEELNKIINEKGTLKFDAVAVANNIITEINKSNKHHAYPQHISRIVEDLTSIVNEEDRGEGNN